MSDFLTQITETHIAGNALWRILALFASILIALVVGKVVQVMANRAAKRADRLGQSTRGAWARALARSGWGLLLVAGLRQGLRFLTLSDKVADVADTVTAVLMTLAIGWVFYCVVNVVDSLLSKAARRTQSKLDDALVPLVRKSLRITVVVLTFVQAATILSDKPLTSLLAGLGVGGLAVALAAQDTIKNFFGSVVILADKPFELGDRIIVDGHDGPVEEVGFRSTRMRTLEGHVVTIPNSELANKLIKNISARPYIRRVMDITITYDTPPEKVDRALAIVKELLENHEGMDPEFPPRVFFNDLNSTSLNLLAIYWYHPPDYWAYMAFTEKFNRALFQRFGEEGIEFAFPTQTVYLAGDDKRPLDLGARG